MVVSEPGETIGYCREGCLDGAIHELAAEVLSDGTARVERFEIDEEAAGDIGLSGPVRLDVQAMRAGPGDPGFAGMLRYLDSGSAAAVVIGTRGASGCGVIGKDRILGHLGWPQSPRPIAEDARRMLGTRQTARRTYGPCGERDGIGTEVWMQSHPVA